MVAVEPAGTAVRLGCSNGQCVCQPNCMGKFCGDNGCGGSCGDCAEPLSCVSGQCICEPDCTGKTCGDDGCGGSCGVCGCDDQKVFVRAANFGAPSELQVFFITEADDTWNEPKSKTVTIDTGGQYETLELPVGEKAKWTGTITGLRIDPMKNDEPFGIDSVCVGVTEDACLLQWTFDGAIEVVSPFLAGKSMPLRTFGPMAIHGGDRRVPFHSWRYKNRPLVPNLPGI